MSSPLIGPHRLDYHPRLALPSPEHAAPWAEPAAAPFKPSPRAIVRDYERQWRQAAHLPKNAPRIGIICDDDQALAGPDQYIRYFTRAVIDSKAQPVFLFPARDSVARQMRDLDGLLIPGGADVDPSFYHAERDPLCGRSWPEDDAFALDCIRRGFDKNLPMFGICRGLQLMNVAAGGTLIQDIPTKFHNPFGVQVEHRTAAPREPEAERNVIRSMPKHDMIVLDPDSQLHHLLGSMCIGISSLHHQCIGVIAPLLRATAIAPDGVIEAVERHDNPQQFALQGHPELTRRVDPRFQKLFDYLVQSSTQYRSEHRHIRAA
jgi:putative glutamine amidotransferase